MADTFVHSNWTLAAAGATVAALSIYAVNNDVVTPIQQGISLAEQHLPALAAQIFNGIQESIPHTANQVVNIVQENGIPLIGTSLGFLIMKKSVHPKIDSNLYKDVFFSTVAGLATVLAADTFGKYSAAQKV